MTEEMIRSIKDAETQGAELKAAAEIRAAQIVADAEKQAARTESSSEEVCKAYRETQLKSARAEAETRYQSTLKAKEKESREYCAKVLEKADENVRAIVRRIVSGDL